MRGFRISQRRRRGRRSVVSRFACFLFFQIFFSIFTFFCNFPFFVFFIVFVFFLVFLGERRNKEERRTQKERRKKNAPTETSPLPQSHAQDLFLNQRAWKQLTPIFTCTCTFTLTFTQASPRHTKNLVRARNSQKQKIRVYVCVQTRVHKTHGACLQADGVALGTVPKGHSGRSANTGGHFQREAALLAGRRKNFTTDSSELAASGTQGLMIFPARSRWKDLERKHSAHKSQFPAFGSLIALDVTSAFPVVGK